MEQKRGSETKRLWFTIGLLSVAWTVVMIVIVATVWSYNDKAVLHIAENKAIASLSKDFIYREWVSRNGGVYVPTTEKTPPNPYLDHIPERDIVTPSGRKLTLINPAYMTRQVHELGLERLGLRGHITSLNPINPVNAPDLWERKALQRFEGKVEPVSSLERIDGQRFLRYINPFVTEQSCLKCHAAQGYQLGQIRGGISVSVPINPIEAAIADNMAFIFKGFIGIWFFGIAGIALAGWNISKQIRQRAGILRESRKNEERFRLLYTQSPIGYQSLDAEGCFVEVNPTWLNLLGYEKEEVIGRSFADFLTGNGKELFEERFPRFKELGEVHSVPFKMVCKDGSCIEVEIDGKIGCRSDGSFKQTHCVLRNVTEQKRAQEALCLSETKYRTLYNSISDAVALMDEDGFFDCNQAALEIFGCVDQKDLCSKHPADLSPPKQPCGTDSLTLANQYIAKVLEEGKSYCFEWIHKKACSDQTFPAEVLLNPMELDGKPILLSVVRDITERKQTETLLRESEARFRDVASSAGEWIWEVDSEGRYTYSSPASKEILGYEPEEMLGEYFYDSFIPEAKEEYKKGAFDVFARKESFQCFANKNVHKDGHVVILETSGVPVLDDKGNLLGYRGADRDVTERKQVEQMLKFTQFAVDHVSDEAYWIDCTGRFVYVNNAACKALGYSCQELLNMTVADVDPDFALEVWPEHWRELRNQQTMRFDSRHKRKDGTVFPVEITANYVSYDGSEYNCAFARDITERKQVEEALRESEDRFRGAFEGAAHGMALVSTTGKWLKVNKSLCDIVGYSEQEMLATDYQTITHPDDLEIDLHYAQELLEGNRESYQMEKRYIHKDGYSVWILLSGSVVRDEQGVPIHFIAQIQDIDKRKQAEEKLLQAKKEAEAANISKSQFLANMSHEIRTPMNSIVGFTDLLFEEELTEDQFDYLNMIKDNSMLLLQLISDILDFSKIDADKLDIEKIECSLETILSKVKSITAFRAEEKGLTYKINTCPDMPSHIITDPTRLIQCLVNLMNNAIKFTEQGHVYLNVSLERRDAKSYIRFDVEDTGVGIPADKLEYVFEAFEQADKSTTRQYGGTGLGLTITKKLVELMDGEITVSSEVGRGAVFSFVLPHQQIQQVVTHFVACH